MKRLRKLLAFIAVACLTLAFGAGAVACSGGNGANNVSYTITVNGAADSVILATVNVNLVNGSGETVASGKLNNGVATIGAPAGEYDVTLESRLLDGYEYDPVKVSADSPSATVTLRKAGTGGGEQVQTTYKITMLYPNGTPVAGAMIQLCKGECTPATTGTDGVATFNLPADVYDIHLTDFLTSGVDETKYAFDDDRYKTTATSTEMTIYLNVIYTVTVTLPGGGPAVNAAVTFTLNGGDSSTAPIRGTTDTSGTAKISAPCGTYSIAVTYGDGAYTHDYASVDNEDVTSAAVSLIEEGDDLRHGIRATTGQRYEVTTQTGTPKYYSFSPQGRSGIYTVESYGSFDTAVSRFSGTAGFVSSAPVDTNDDRADGNKNFLLEFTIPDYEVEGDGAGGNQWVFAFSAKEAQATFEVEFKRTGDYVSTPGIPTTEAPHEQTAAEPYPIPADSTFTLLPLDTEVTRASDGYYRVGGETGDVVLVALSGSKYKGRAMTDSFENAYTESGGIGFTISDGATYSYDYGPLVTAYTEACNADGLHPLTDELKEFLSRYAVTSGIYAYDDVDLDCNSPYLYLFACGVYKSDYLAFAGGSGSAEAPYTLGEYGPYKINVTAGATVWISASDDVTVRTKTVGARITVGSENHDCTAASGITVDVTGSGEAKRTFGVTSTDGSAKTVIIEVVGPKGSLSNPLSLSASANSVTVTESAGAVYCEFTPGALNLYTISLGASGKLSGVTTLPGVQLAANGSVTLELSSGRSYVFKAEHTDSDDLTITIATFTDQKFPSGSGSESSPYVINGMGWYRVNATATIDGDNYGAYFSFTPGDSATYRVTVYNEKAHVVMNDVAFADPTDGEPDSITFTADPTETYKFLMGTTSGPATYYFYIEKVEA